MRRLSFVLPFLLGLSIQPLLPANAAPQKTAEPEAEEKTYTGRLPRYYGKVGVSDDQRQAIYKIQTEYALKIDPLLDEVETLRQDRDADVADVLTDEQTAEIKKLRAEARAKRQRS